MEAFYQTKFEACAHTSPIFPLLYARSKGNIADVIISLLSYMSEIVILAGSQFHSYLSAVHIYDFHIFIFILVIPRGIFDI